MAEKRTRRSFTREFKAQAVKRLLEGGRGLSEVSTELGLSTGQLSTWRTEISVAVTPVASCARRTAGAAGMTVAAAVSSIRQRSMGDFPFPFGSPVRDPDEGESMPPDDQRH